MFMNTNEVQQIREQFQPGTMIELESLNDPYTNLKTGDRGVVAVVDDAGQIHMKWDNGSGLALVPGVDRFHIVKQ